MSSSLQPSLKDVDTMKNMDVRTLLSRRRRAHRRGRTNANRIEHKNINLDTDSSNPHKQSSHVRLQGEVLVSQACPVVQGAPRRTGRWMSGGPGAAAAVEKKKKRSKGKFGATYSPFFAKHLSDRGSSRRAKEHEFHDFCWVKSPGVLGRCRRASSWKVMESPVTSSCRSTCPMSTYARPVE